MVGEIMDFGAALIHMKQGKKVTRRGWNGKGMHIAIQNPDEHSMNKASYIYMIPVDEQRVPWVASQSDLLKEDWEIVD